MSANIFGERFKFISFGESHGPAYGVVIEGMPANIKIDEQLLNTNMQRRRPGQGDFTTARHESDVPEILSGVFEGKSLGTPITIIVRNLDQRSGDYDQIKNAPRIGHADDVWKNKFGHSDHRGGGRSSGRETLCRVIAGSFAQMIFQSLNIKTEVHAFAEQIGPHQLIESKTLSEDIKSFLSEAKAQGESYGGIVKCRIQHVPKNLGQPIFHKLKSDLASAMMSLGAVEGFEFGAGFASSNMKGSDFHSRSDSENYGGIRGGISTGEEITFRVAFKPTSSITDVAKKGRHDPCIVPRALPVVEAMVWCVLADHLLWTRTDKI
jgi:chorismate synthase